MGTASLSAHTCDPPYREAPLIPSARLEAILSLLHPCRLLADVGTDHGFVPVLAVKRGLAERAIAADLREAPLALARRQIAEAAVGDRVSTLLGDGLVALRGQSVDAVVMAGMSGALMQRLCEAAPDVLRGVEQLVLQPNNDADLVRAWARKNAWHVRDERMVQTRGRFFVVCAFAHGSGTDPAYAQSGWTEEMLLRVGPCLARRKDAVALRYCEAQRTRLQQLVSEGVQTHEAELSGFEAACELMQ